MGMSARTRDRSPAGHLLGRVVAVQPAATGCSASRRIACACWPPSTRPRCSRGSWPAWRLPCPNGWTRRSPKTPGSQRPARHPCTRRPDELIRRTFTRYMPCGLRSWPPREEASRFAQISAGDAGLPAMDRATVASSRRYSASGQAAGILALGGRLVLVEIGAGRGAPSRPWRSAEALARD